MDEEIEQAFLIAINRLPTDRAKYCDTYEIKFLPLIGNTESLEETQNLVREQMLALIAEAEKLIAENATVAQDQTIYNQKFNKIYGSIEEKKAKIAEIDIQISEALARKENARIYLEGLREAGSGFLITKFDVRLWHKVVEYVKVMPDATLVFHFRNGHEESVSLKEAQQKPYDGLQS